MELDCPDALQRKGTRLNRSSRRRPTAVVRSSVVVAIAAAVVGVGVAAPAQAAPSQTVSFSDFDVWVVPAGVFSVAVELTGGDGGAATTSGDPIVVATGGRGGAVSGTITVTPGDELSFRVAQAGSGANIDVLADLATGGTGFGQGGRGYAPGGGSTAVQLNGALIAGAPGGGGGGGIFSIKVGENFFAAYGGSGGVDGDPITGLNGLVSGGASGGNLGSNDGQGSDFSALTANNIVVYVVAGGAGGAGWPGGAHGLDARSNNNAEVYATGGGGGSSFISAELLNPTVATKALGAVAAGTAQITFTPAIKLAATGTNDSIMLVGFAAVLLLAGGLALFVSRKRVARR